MKKLLGLFIFILLGFVLIGCNSDQQTPAVHEHTFSTTWTTNEEYHWHAATCEHVDELRDKEEHEWNEGVVTKNPTTTENGEKVYTCSVCEYKKTEVLEQVEEVEIVYQLINNDGSASNDKKAIFNSSNNTHVIAANNLKNVGSIDLYINNKVLNLSELTITGDFGSDESAAFYLDSTIVNSLLVGVPSECVVITYNHSEKTLKIEAVELIVSEEAYLTYVISDGSSQLSGNGELDSDGKYYFDVTLTGFRRVLIYVEGTQITTSNTEISGSFKDQIDATWTKDLYIADDNGIDLVYYLDGSCDYTFHYTPAEGENKAKLEIEYHEPVIEEDGFIATAVQHVDSINSNGDELTVVFVSGSTYGGVRLYYNGNEIVPSNVTVTGSGYYSDWGSVNNSPTKQGIYYQTDDGTSAPGWFTISSCTAVFVYDASSNTLTITVQ